MNKRAIKADNQSISQVSPSALSTVNSSSPSSFSLHTDKDWNRTQKTLAQSLTSLSVYSFAVMFSIAITFVIFGAKFFLIGVDGALGDKKQINLQEPLGLSIDPVRYKTACPDYRHYAVIPQWVPVLLLEI